MRKKITILMLSILIIALYAGVAVGAENDNIAIKKTAAPLKGYIYQTKKIFVPPFERNYMLLDPQAQKLEDDHWNKTPILPFNQSLTTNNKTILYVRDWENNRDYLSILDIIPYTPRDRDQGNSGNCWIWAGTAALEASHTISNGYKDRLSIEFADAGVSGWSSCKGGDPYAFASFYNGIGYAIPWENSKGDYQDTYLNHDTCEGTHVSFDSIAKDPNYRINGNIQPNRIVEGSEANYITQIKNQLLQGNPVIICIHAPNENAMRNYFDFGNSPQNYVYDFSSAWGDADGADMDMPGHEMLIVGYNDDINNPSSSYWIVLNSWGTPAGHPDGTFKLAMRPAKGYGASFDKWGWTTGDENVMELYVFSYNGNANQAFIQEPAKPLSLKVKSITYNKETGQPHVVFEVRDWGYPNQGTIKIGDRVITGHYDVQAEEYNPERKSEFGGGSTHLFEADLDPDTYNPSYYSKNEVGQGGPIYLSSPLVIRGPDPEPEFTYQLPNSCDLLDNEAKPTGYPGVKFYDQSLYGASAYRWHWDFGDGKTSDEQNPEHAYLSTGSYTVTLSVWNKWGGPKAITKNVEVSWKADCGRPDGHFKTFSLQFYPPGYIWDGELPISEQDQLGDKVINAQVEVSSPSYIHMLAETVQRDTSTGINDQLGNSGINLRGQAYNEHALISPENSYNVKAINVKVSPSKNVYVPVETIQNNTSIVINNSFVHLETIFGDKKYNETILDSLLNKTKVVTPILVIQPKKSSKIKFTVDTSDLDPGYYKFVVTLRDPNTHEVITQEPVFFGVLGVPNIQVNPTSLDFGTLNIGQVNQNQFTISNTGNVNLGYNITIPDECSASSLQGTVPAHKSKTITLSVDTVYAAQEPFSVERSVVITSNSSTNETISIPVTYTLNAPRANLVRMNAPSNLSAGDTYTLNITMHNEGSIPWDDKYTLGVPDVGDAGKFVSSDASPVARVNPEENTTYQLTLHAPSAPGDYMLALEMYYQDANNIKRFFGWPVFIGITVKKQLEPKKGIEIGKTLSNSTIVINQNNKLLRNNSTN